MDAMIPGTAKLESAAKRTNASLAWTEDSVPGVEAPQTAKQERRSRAMELEGWEELKC
jgi:hypothetical protein